MTACPAFQANVLHEYFLLQQPSPYHLLQSAPPWFQQPAHAHSTILAVRVATTCQSQKSLVMNKWPTKKMWKVFKEHVRSFSNYIWSTKVGIAMYRILSSEPKAAVYRLVCTFKMCSREKTSTEVLQSWRAGSIISITRASQAWTALINRCSISCSSSLSKEKTRLLASQEITTMNNHSIANLDC